jgi:hypothetical protein
VGELLGAAVLAAAAWAVAVPARAAWAFCVAWAA